MYGFAQDRGGDVWAASAGGLMRFDGSRWQAIGVEWNVPLGAVYQVAVDPEGTVWIFAPGALLKLDAVRKRFVFVLRGVAGKSFKQDVDGIIWTRSAENRGLPPGTPDQTLRPMTNEFGFLIDRAGATWDSEGDHRGGFRQGGLAAVDASRSTGSTCSGSSRWIRGNIWFGSSNGLHRFITR